MERKAVSEIMLSLLITSIFAVAFNIPPVKASGTIYIRADGSVDPPTAPIIRNGDLYTLTGNITSSGNGILIQRDNMTLDGAGYMLQGSGAGSTGMANGTYIVGRANVTIKNLRISNYWGGVSVDGSSECAFLSNEIENNTNGIRLARSSNNSINKNRLTASVSCAIHIWPGPAYDNRILENNITNARHGIITYCPQNQFNNNTIVNCVYGIDLIYGSGSTVCNNTFSSAGLLVHGSYGNAIENNIVNGKPLVYLEGASDQTIEDAGQVILVNCNKIRAQNLNLSDTSYPVQLWGTNSSRIKNNKITANIWNGIQLYFSSNNTLEGNNIAEKHYRGIYFYSSSYNTLRNNSMSADNYFNFFIEGTDLSHFIHDVDDSNTVNGRPIYYWINKKETSVPQDAGYVALVNCTRITVQNLTLSKNAQAIMLAFTTNSTVTQNNLTRNEYDVYLYESQDNEISGNNMTNDWYGVYLHNSSNNTIQENKMLGINYHGIASHYSSNNHIVRNTIAAWYGTWLESSSNNLIHHNYFVGTTTHQFFSQNSVNVWDDGYPSGGNYWSDYAGTDEYTGLYQNVTGSDGIGDTPYIIDQDNIDHYPLKTHDNALTGVRSFKTIVGQTHSLPIYVTVENHGYNTESLNVSVYADSTMIGLMKLTLTEGESTTLTFVWNTSGFVKGSYTISAYAWPVPGESDTMDNTYPDGNVIVAMVGDITGTTLFVPDGKVDGRDIALVAKYFGSISGHPPNVDINSDGKIDGRDIAIVSQNFGTVDP